MAKEKLEDLSIDQLKKKEKGLKGFILIFIPLIIALFYFIIRDYLNGEEVDWSTVTIGICTLGGPAALYPELKSIQNEIKKRS